MTKRPIIQDYDDRLRLSSRETPGILIDRMSSVLNRPDGPPDEDGNLDLVFTLPKNERERLIEIIRLLELHPNDVLD